MQAQAGSHAQLHEGKRARGRQNQLPAQRPGLKTNFGWLFAQAQANATLGQSYVYDDANLGSTPNLLGEYGNGGTKSTGRIEYIWLPTEGGTSIPIGIYKGGRFLAVHSDHLGTPRLITDDTSKPMWQWPYSAFGDNKPTGVLKATPNPKAAITNQPVLLKTTAATEINLRFAGQYFDEESNLAYNYFRSYQPTQGRYTQADPIGLEGGLNRFGYVEGDPLSKADPTGLIPLIPLLALADLVLLIDSIANGPAPLPVGGEYWVVAHWVRRRVVAQKLCPTLRWSAEGPLCTADRFANGSGVSVSNDLLIGVSVNSASGRSLRELSASFPNPKVGVTTVGDIRRAGGDVVSSPTANNPFHSTMSGVSPTQAQQLFGPVVRNPNR